MRFQQIGIFNSRKLNRRLEVVLETDENLEVLGTFGSWITDGDRELKKTTGAFAKINEGHSICLRYERWEQ